MRIALLTYSTKPRGGVVHTLNLAEALADLGESVTVITLGRGGDRGFFRPVNESVGVVVLAFSEVVGEGVGERILRSIDTMASGFPSGNFDVVHAQDCISANAVPGSIRTVHHLDTFATPQLVRCHNNGILRPSHHVCVSEAVAEQLRLRWGISATVIPNGVEQARFAQAASDHPDHVAARERWAKRLGGPYVVTVGGIEPRKGSLDLASAFGLARSYGLDPDIRLAIAGGETLFDYRSYREAFDRHCQALGVAPIILGPVPHPEMASLVAGATAFMFPSLMEGFGLAPLEAAAAGVPVVARDIAVLKAVLGKGARFATDPESMARALLEATREPDFDMLAAGRATASRFSWEATAQAHLELYNQVLAERPVAAHPCQQAPREACWHTRENHPMPAEQ